MSISYTPPDPPPALLPDALRFPLNEANDWQAIEQEYLGMDPGIVYVDNFLTPEALESVRRLCLESTTFYDVRSTCVCKLVCAQVLESKLLTAVLTTYGGVIAASAAAMWVPTLRKGLQVT